MNIGHLPRFQKTYFQIIEKFEIFYGCAYSCSICTQKISSKHNDYGGLCKNDKKCLVKGFVLSTEICLFCGCKIKIYFFTKIYAARMFQRDVHIKFYFGIFTHFNHI